MVALIVTLLIIGSISFFITKKVYKRNIEKKKSTLFSLSLVTFGGSFITMSTPIVIIFFLANLKCNRGNPNDREGVKADSTIPLSDSSKFDSNQVDTNASTYSNKYSSHLK